MLVSPDGENVQSVAAVDAAEADRLLAAGWRRIPPERFLRETADKLGIEPG